MLKELSFVTSVAKLSLNERIPVGSFAPVHVLLLPAFYHANCAVVQFAVKSLPIVLVLHQENEMGHIALLNAV